MNIILQMLKITACLIAVLFLFGAATVVLLFVYNLFGLLERGWFNDLVLNDYPSIGILYVALTAIVFKAEKNGNVFTLTAAFATIMYALLKIAPDLKWTLETISNYSFAAWFQVAPWPYLLMSATPIIASVAIISIVLFRKNRNKSGL